MDRRKDAAVLLGSIGSLERMAHSSNLTLDELMAKGKYPPTAGRSSS
jgi:hypothetical protein